MTARSAVASLRAGVWAARATLHVRRRLRHHGIDGWELRGPPMVPANARRGVNAVLRLVRPSCLERAIVLQRWLAAHGERRDVVVGVAGSLDNFRAHAWIEGEPDSHPTEFTEITRFRP